jgi:protein-tyrosine phosphatase
MDPISPELVLVDPGLADASRPGWPSALLRVAFICTGNRFRSALAEAAFRAAAGDLPLEVVSYGTLDVGSVGPLPLALSAAEAHGLDISEHVARPLATADLADSLVVGFERVHADAAVALARAAPERTFLLVHLVDLLDSLPLHLSPDAVEHAAVAIARAHSSRLSESPRRVGGEIPDPTAFSKDDQLAIGRIVYDEVTALARSLFGRRRALSAWPPPRSDALLR